MSRLQQNFFKTSELVREARRKAISEARKTELKIHTRTRAKSHSHVALVETLAIVVIGLAIGATGYLGTVATPSAAIQGNYSFLEQLAVSVYRFVSPETSVVVHTNTQPKNPSLEATAVSAQIATTTYTSLVVAPDELFTATSVESIQESFSDPVTVSIDPENPQTGIITPIFKEGMVMRIASSWCRSPQRLNKILCVPSVHNRIASSHSSQS